MPSDPVSSDWASPDALLEHALAVAKRHGATSADALYSSGRSTEVRVRLGDVEQVKQSRSKGLGLRVFFGQRSASTSTSVLDREALTDLIARTCAAAKVTAEDPHAGLAEASAFDEAPVDATSLDLYDAALEAFDADRAADMARQCEAAAMGADPRLENSEGAEMSWGVSGLTLATSHGTMRSRRSSSVGLWTTPVATTPDGGMERDYWYSYARHFAALETPEAVGLEAAKRTLRRLGARKPETCTVPVIYEAPVASRLLGSLAGAANGGSVYRNASWLVGKVGERIASPLVTITDDPLIVRGPGSKPFDGEGLATSALTLVKGGVLEAYLLDTYTGRKLGMASNRRASRGLGGSPSPSTTNLWMAPGEQSLDELIASTQRGLLVTELFGFGVNQVTGDYSQGAAGLWIEDGAIAYPVSELTIASTLPAMWQRVDALASDRDPTRGTSAPSLRIAEMTVAGT